MSGPVRTPVLLVPGWSDTAPFLGEFRDRFLASGWDASGVAIARFRNRFGSNVTHAGELVEAIEGLSGLSGGGQVDIVGHSMGGLAVRHLLVRIDASAVRRAVFLATPHRGTYTAYFAWGDGGLEMQPGSEFLQGLDAPTPVPALALYSLVDTHVLPMSSALSPHMTNQRVWCSHRGIIRHSGAFDRVRKFLTDPE